VRPHHRTLNRLIQTEVTVPQTVLLVTMQHFQQMLSKVICDTNKTYWVCAVCHSRCPMALGSTQPPTEMSTRNLLGGKGQPVHKSDNLTDICEPIFWKMWELRHLTTLWASTACYRDSFTFTFSPFKRKMFEVKFHGWLHTPNCLSVSVIVSNMLTSVGLRISQHLREISLNITLRNQC
jgi:hypothetical protein